MSTDYTVSMDTLGSYRHSKAKDLGGPRPGGCRLCCRGFLAYWRTYVLILAPVILAPMLMWSMWSHKQACCLYVIALMSMYWRTEALPPAITSLLPSFLFPLLGIMSVEDTCRAYFESTNFLIFATLVLGLAMRCSGLQKRMALLSLKLVGGDPKWIVALTIFMGFSTSMTLPNIVTAGLLLPIVVGMIEEMLQLRNEITDENGVTVNLLEKMHEREHKHLRPCTHERVFPLLPSEDQRAAKAILIAFYASINIGGTMMLNGTEVNRIALKALNESGHKLEVAAQHNATGLDLTFVTWAVYQAPAMTLLLLLTWLWVCLLILGVRQFGLYCGRNMRDSKASFGAKYAELGKARFEEWITILLVIISAVLVLTRDFRDGFDFIEVSGWGSAFEESFIKDAVPMLAIAFLFFVLPRSKPDFCFKKDNRWRPRLRKTIVTLRDMQRHFPWSVLLLMGGGFAISRAVQEVGIQKTISDLLSQRDFDSINSNVLCLCIIAVITCVTQIITNTATTLIFLPILIDLATRLNLSPLLFALPAATSASMAFMLPTATPVNAIVFGTGLLRIRDMVLSGLGLNVLAILINFANIATYGRWLFGLE